MRACEKRERREKAGNLTEKKTNLFIVQQFILHKTHTINQKETEIEKNPEL